MGKESWWKLKVTQRDMWLVAILAGLALSRSLTPIARDYLGTRSAQSSAFEQSIRAPDEESRLTALQKLREIKAHADREHQQQEQTALLLLAGMLVTAIGVGFGIGYGVWGRKKKGLDMTTHSPEQAINYFKWPGIKITLSWIAVCVFGFWWLVLLFVTLFLGGNFEYLVLGILMTPIVLGLLGYIAWERNRIKNRYSRGERS